MRIALSAEFGIISDIYMSLIIRGVKIEVALNIYIVQCLRYLSLAKGRLSCKDDIVTLPRNIFERTA
jgi:hypothetical protein